MTSPHRRDRARKAKNRSPRLRSPGRHRFRLYVTDVSAARFACGAVSQVPAVASSSGAGSSRWPWGRKGREVWLLGCVAEVPPVRRRSVPEVGGGPLWLRFKGRHPAEHPRTRRAPERAVSHGRSRGTAGPTWRSPGNVCAAQMPVGPLPAVIPKLRAQVRFSSPTP